MRATIFGPMGIALLAITACQGGEWSEACVAFSVCEPELLDPEQVVVLCDASRGAPCTPEALDATVRPILEQVVTAPASSVSVWAMGEDVGSTQRLANVVVSAPGRSGIRTVAADRDRQLENATAAVREATRPYFEGDPPGQSPLLEGLGVIGLARAGEPGAAWHLVLVSDGLVYDGHYDFECSPPSDVERFVQTVFESGVLTTEALLGAHVTFAYQALAPIDGNRCPVEIAGARKLRELWTTLLTASGARTVTFEPGPPSAERLAQAHASPIEGGIR